MDWKWRNQAARTSIDVSCVGRSCNSGVPRIENKGTSLPQVSSSQRLEHNEFLLHYMYSVFKFNSSTTNSFFYILQVLPGNYY